MVERIEEFGVTFDLNAFFNRDGLHNRWTRRISTADCLVIAVIPGVCRRSPWVRRHGRAVPGCPLPVIDPLVANTIGPLDEFVARASPVLDHDDDPCIEFPLRVIDIGQASMSIDPAIAP